MLRRIIENVNATWFDSTNNPLNGKNLDTLYVVDVGIESVLAHLSWFNDILMVYICNSNAESSATSAV